MKHYIKHSKLLFNKIEYCVRNLIRSHFVIIILNLIVEIKYNNNDCRVAKK